MHTSRKTLLLVAVKAEADDLISDEATPFWRNPAAPNSYPQEAYRLSDGLVLGLTGPMGHSMCAVATLLLQLNAGKPPFERVVNFGGAGTYTWSCAAAHYVTPTYKPKAWFVGKSRRWDQFIPARGFEFYGQTAELEFPPDQPALCCQTGSRFSSYSDQQHPDFLQGDLEDNELYDLSRWAQIQSLPLTSIKFVTNLTTPTGALDYFANLPSARKAGTQLLASFLRG